MFKKILVATALFSSVPAAAESCYEALTLGHTKDSHAFQLSESEVGNIDDIGIEYMTAAVDSLMKKLACTDPVVVDATQSDCVEVIPGNTESEVCYLRTNLGYFIGNVDYLMNANLVFNRLD